MFEDVTISTPPEANSCNAALAPWEGIKRIALSGKPAARNIPILLRCQIEFNPLPDAFNFPGLALA